MTSSTKTGRVSIENKTAFHRKYHISKIDKNKENKSGKKRNCRVRNPDEVHEVTVQRNDECPCGSGN